MRTRKGDAGGWQIIVFLILGLMAVIIAVAFALNAKNEGFDIIDRISRLF
ncbi:MAG: hypothetical protein ABIH34_05710 [Nanoarchaeota archaeon]